MSHAAVELVKFHFFHFLNIFFSFSFSSSESKDKSNFCSTCILTLAIDQQGSYLSSLFYQWIHSVGLTPTEPVSPWSRACILLKKYERMELSSLIELAAWKHACVIIIVY
jgi:hypothetical protein